MTRTITSARAVLAASVAVAALTIGAGGVAAAATTTTTTARTPAAAFDCARFEGRLSRVQAREASWNKALARLTGAEVKAQKAGKTARVNRLKRDIAHEQKIIAHAANSRFMTKTTHRAAGVCHTAPVSGATG